VLKVSDKGRKMKKISKDQGGVVSILVTVVFILLLSMIVLAMAENSNREQRQSLDRQLSDQAFYNAESGISDWAKYLQENANAPTVKSKCDLSEGSFPGTVPSGTVDNDVNRYTCVTYDKQPKSIEQKPLSTDDAKFYAIKGTQKIQSLRIQWNANPSGSVTTGCNAPGNGLASSLGAQCNVGGVRIDLFPFGDRDSMIRSNLITYLVPSNAAPVNATLAANSLNYPNNQGVIVPTRCDANGCTVTITGLDIDANENYTISMKALYNDNRVKVEGLNGATVVGLIDAQYELDSTGKANDVLRRIKVRVPASLSYTIPGTGGSDVLATRESICKLIDVNQVQDTATFTDPACAD